MISHSVRLLPMINRYFFGPSVSFGEDSKWIGFTVGYMIGG